MIEVPIWAFWTFIPTLFSVGFYVGYYGSRFVSRKECEAHRAEFWHEINMAKSERSEIRVDIAGLKEA